VKLVAHISDPHFGTEDPEIAGELLRELRTLDPAVVAISGDLTQRARRSQFRTARDWLAHLGVPYVVVPGNHDIPLYDVFRRFAQPRDRFHDYISREPTPCFFDDTLAVCGIDTTKALTTKHGVARREQIDYVVRRFLAYEHSWRIVVAHHPFVVPPGAAKPVVSGASEAIERFERARVDLILTGHLHAPHSDSAADRNERHSLIHVHAGTCMSTRTRGEPNGYNQLAFDGDTVTITHRYWTGTRFVDGPSKSYQRITGGDRGSRDHDRYEHIHTRPSDRPADTRDTDRVPSARG
jgi:3',5'-cyclic AMP phosphodiesterase CpdA